MKVVKALAAGTIMRGNPYDLKPGDVVNFGSGPATVTVIQRSLLQLVVTTSRGRLVCGLDTELLFFRPEGGER